MQTTFTPMTNKQSYLQKVVLRIAMVIVVVLSLMGQANAQCSITLRPSVSGCYYDVASGTSKATVTVEVSWVDGYIPANESIIVNYNGILRTVTPGKIKVDYGRPSGSSSFGDQYIYSPQIVAYEVTANGASGQTITASITTNFNAPTSCTISSLPTTFSIPSACAPTLCASGELGGTVFYDYNADGVKNAGDLSGLAGITVKAYATDGSVFSTLSDSDGKYTFTGASAIPSGKYPVRVEFTLPPVLASIYGSGTQNGADGKTSVQFVQLPNCSLDLGVINPNDFCQDVPKVIVPCYFAGDPLVAGAAGLGDVLVMFDYGTTGQTPNYSNNSVTVLAKAAQAGTLWGVGYNKFNKKIYSSAVVRRHSGLGPLGLGGIYVTDIQTQTTTNLVDVTTLGVNVGTIADNTARNLVGDPLAFSNDPQALSAIGRLGIGDLDVSEDGNSLFFTNLFTNDLVKMNISGTTATSYAVPNPGCTNGIFRIWGIKVYKGKVYVGGLCDGSTSPNSPIKAKGSDMRAYVYVFDVATSTFDPTPVFDFPLTYPKGFPFGGRNDVTGWYAWTDDWNTLLSTIPDNAGASAQFISYPQPIFSDIEFDVDGSMVLGFSDRSAFQTAYRNYPPTGTGNVSGFSGGDLLRAAKIGNSFILENAAKVSSVTGYGPTNNQGPGFGEFYDDNYVRSDNDEYPHTEKSLGGLAIRPGSGEVIYSAMDPINGNNDSYNNSGGITYNILPSAKFCA